MLSDYRTLGRSGLMVSPLALGTMTFGTARWGTGDDVSEAVFNAYVDAGGNLIDSADVYAQGHSEELIGTLVQRRRLREQLVLSTKSGFAGDASGNPHAGGNGRKHIRSALDASLRRLRTDHVDLYWIHVWDMVTPVEEVLQTMGELVREGRVRYFGFSNVPAWYYTKAATLAQARGVPGPIALQMEYSLTERRIEVEHVDAARECGGSVVAWSPLAGGFLTGKYQRNHPLPQARLNGGNPFGDQKFSERNWQMLGALQGLARELDSTMATVALAWALAKPGVATALIGATSSEQLRANMAAAALRLDASQVCMLDAASAPDQAPFFSPQLQRMVFGGAAVRRHQAA